MPLEGRHWFDIKMGCYDTVDFSIPCPVCGRLIKDFQTKSLACLFNTVQPWTTPNFYASCPSGKCRTWIEYTVKESVVFPTLKDTTHYLRLAVDGQLSDAEKGEIKTLLNFLDHWQDYYDVEIQPLPKGTE